jgi:CHAD domain-containing protein
MAYRLDLGASLAEAVQDVARDQLSKAEHDLTDGGIDRGEGVHDARKSLKKLRGLLRLARPALGTSYKLENVMLRDCGRRLAGARDADAMVECIKRLRKQYDGDLDGKGKALQQAVEAWRDEALPDETAFEEKVAAVVATLGKAVVRLEHWPLPDDDRQPLLGGLTKTYRRGRKAFLKAYRKPGGARFHDWRKRVKYHWYHLRLLRDVWPEIMKARAKETKKLSDLLGDDHDLTVMRAMVTDERIAFREDDLQAVMLGMIEHDQADLRTKAHRLGDRLFAEKPKHLNARIDAYWSAE